MTKSDNSQSGAGVLGQPQQMQAPGQQVPQAQIDPGLYNPGQQQLPPPQPGAGHQPYQAQMNHGQPMGNQAGQPMPPMQQQVGGQLPPPAMPVAPHQGQQVMPGAEQMTEHQMAPQFEAPIEDYQYPQGHSVLPEVPAVAVPPATRAPAEHMQQVQTPHTHAQPHQPADSGFGETSAISSAGEQISQRLAQLQSQYDEEVSQEGWSEAQVTNTGTHQAVDQFSGQQPVSEEFVGAPADPHAQHEQFAAGEPFISPEQIVHPDQLAAQNYQEQPPQAYQQPAQNYQEQPQTYQEQAQFAPPPPMTPQGSYEYAGPTADVSQQQFIGEEQPFAGHAPIQQEMPSGSGIKKVMFGGAFVAALAVGGGAAYTYQYTDLFGPGGSNGPAPTIKAGSSPIKFLKKKLAGAGESINKAMHNRLSGSDTDTNSSNGLDDLDKIVDAARIAGNKAAASSNGMISDIGAKKPSVSSTGMSAPRRVKTLIVRPDGTILRPAGNNVAKAIKTGVMKHVSAPAIGAVTPSKAGAFKVSGGNRIRRMKTIGEASSARILGNGAIAPPAKSLNIKPRSQIVKKTIVKKILKPRKPTVIANAAPAQSLGSVGTPFVVQVTSRSSQTSALAAFADMQQKYPNLIGAYAPDIQRADLGSKGVWYRLRVGPVGSKVAASDLCSNLKQAGHPGCFVRRK